MKRDNFEEFLIVASGWSAKFYNKKEADKVFESLFHGSFYGLTTSGLRVLLIVK